MQEINYFAPTTIGEALAYYKKHPEATLFAGGTDLLVGLEYKKIKLKSILDLKSVPELNYIRTEGKTLKIGAMATITDVEKNPFIVKNYPFLSEAASKLGSWQIRNTATVGGNICNAAPSAELTPSLLVLESKVTLIGPNGERTLPLNEFLKGPGKTDLMKGEMLKEIEIPSIPENAVGSYMCRKLRRSMDVALVNLAVLIVMDNEVIKDARVCLGAVGPTVFRACETEKALIGKHLNEDVIIKASEIAAGEAKPITDVRSSAEYRREMVKVYTKRAMIAIKEREVEA